MEKTKILFLINTLKGGGAEKVLVDTVNMLCKDEFEVTVQTIMDDGVHKTSLDSQVNYKSIVKVKNKYLFRLFSYLVQFVLPPKLVYLMFVRGRYDFEVAFLEGIPAKILSGSTNKKAKKYAWIHTDMHMHFDAHRRIHKNVEQHKKMYARFDKIICVSKGAKEGFVKQFGEFENIKVIYNVYNDKDIVSKAHEAQNVIEQGKSFNVISVGRLCEVKGFDRLLRVHKRLIEEGLFHKLYIMGEGDKRHELENYIQKEELQNNVFLLGFDKNPYKYMQACDLFICASYAEGLSTVVAEMLILGKPVVSTQVAGANELLANGSAGMIVENSEDGIYHGLKTMLTNRDAYQMYLDGAQKRSTELTADVLIEPIKKIFEV